jgi:hypothetical protein
MVRREDHEAWHVLFDNLSVEKMYRRFCDLYEIFATDIQRTPVQAMFMKSWVRRKKSRIKKSNAWKVLFGEDSLVQIVTKINAVWIDPNFKLTVKPKRRLTMAIELQPRIRD